MWLIKTDTLELEYRQISPEGAYAILSHTWGTDAEELNFREFKAGGGREKIGFEKIRLCCEQAQQDGLQYAWVDTCCIDKDSSTELSEAINSMFAWYREAKICYVYLADVNYYDPLLSGGAPRQFPNSRWFTRGWTLQELIAPHTVVFFTRQWMEIGNKIHLADELQSITGIDKGVLSNATNFLDYSIAQRMSWASMRQTTRLEDNAYCLIGLFNVSLNLLYGEGSRAFLRLQQEIISQTDDETVFAWFGPSKDGTGLLSPSAKHFARCGNVLHAKGYHEIRERPPYQNLNRGLQIECQLLPYAMSTYAMPLNCNELREDGSVRQVVIAISRTLKEDQYRRIPLVRDASYPDMAFDFADATVSTIFVPDAGRGLDLAPNSGLPVLHFRPGLELWKFPITPKVLGNRVGTGARSANGDPENGPLLRDPWDSQSPMCSASRIDTPLPLLPGELICGVLVACKTLSDHSPNFRYFLQFGFDLEFKPVCIVYRNASFRLWSANSLVRWLTARFGLTHSFVPRAIYGKQKMAKMRFVRLEGVTYRLTIFGSRGLLRPTMFRGDRLKGFRSESVIGTYSPFSCRKVRVSMRPADGLNWDIGISEEHRHGQTNGQTIMPYLCWRCSCVSLVTIIVCLLICFWLGGMLYFVSRYVAIWFDLSIGQASYIHILLILVYGPKAAARLIEQFCPGQNKGFNIIDVR